MTLRHFDVVVIGRSLGCLTAAALLARRDLRVLVLGQGELPASYSFRGRRIERRAFSLLFGETPVWRNLTELDLAYVELDDEGARRWAADPPPRRVPLLRIGASRMSHEGIVSLRAVAERVTREARP